MGEGGAVGREKNVSGWRKEGGRLFREGCGGDRLGRGRLREGENEGKLQAGGRNGKLNKRCSEKEGDKRKSQVLEEECLRVEIERIVDVRGGKL